MLDKKIQRHLDLLIDRYPQLLNCKEDIEKAYLILEECYENDHKLLIAGNGGSAADSEHIAGELMKRFKIQRSIPSDFAKKLKEIDQTRGADLANNLERGLMAIPLVAHEALTTAYINDVDGLGVFAQQLYGFARLGDVKGQKEIIETSLLAAAGGHNMLMIGEPGCGKTMIAQRIPTILPLMTEEECLEVTKIYSISGLLPAGHSLIRNRPFRAPHHNASLNSLIGGGVNAMPGEVSLAHNGVLFLDELAEFSRRTLDALRQPIEDKKVSVARVNGTHTYPAGFMFVTAMNPCPCGYYPGSKCRCTDYEIIKYRGKISGPIMDRIDIQKEVHPVGFFDIENQNATYSSMELREKVESARRIQQDRYKDEEGISCNAQMTTSMIQKYCELDADSLKLLKETSEKYGYSARVIHKLLRLARTSADLDGVEKIRKEDIEKVLSCRDLDESNSKMMVVK